MNDPEGINQPVQFVIEPPKGLSLNVREVWEYRELFYFFAWRDVKIKYKQTSLGILWVVLQPMLTVFVFSLFFGRTLDGRSVGIPYPVFVFSGLLIWNLFSAGVNSAGNSMLTNAAVIKKIYFPRFIIPIASILVALVDFCIAFIVFLAVLVYYYVPINYLDLIMYWPLSILVMLTGTIGVSSWLAGLTVKYRDFKYVVPFGLQILLFLSPVIYPGSVIKNEWLRHLLALNPMYGAINFFRIPLTGHTEDISLLMISCGSAFFLFVWGVYYFKKTESFFADIA